MPILPDFNANDVHHIINHSQSKLLFVGDTFWDIVETENAEGIQYQALPGVMEENLRALNSLVAPYEKGVAGDTLSQRVRKDAQKEHQTIPV